MRSDASWAGGAVLPPKNVRAVRRSRVLRFGVAQSAITKSDQYLLPQKNWSYPSPASTNGAAVLIATLATTTGTVLSFPQLALRAASARCSTRCCALGDPDATTMALARARR